MDETFMHWWFTDFRGNSYSVWPRKSDEPSSVDFLILDPSKGSVGEAHRYVK